MARGEVPSWNGAIFSGTPLLASYRPGALHPLMLALAPLAALLRVPGAGAGLARLTGPLAYLYARRLGAGGVGALTTALGFALGPHLVAHLGDTATVVAAPALPLLLLARRTPGAAGTRARATLGLAAAARSSCCPGPGMPSGGGAPARRAAAARVPPGSARSSRSTRARSPHVGARRRRAARGAAAPADARGAARGGRGGAGDAFAAPAPLARRGGLRRRYVSHSPAPIFALASVPLLRSVPALRAAAAVVGLVLLLFAARGGADVQGPLPLAFDLALAVLAGLALSVQWQARREPSGARVRRLALVAALAAAAALSIATTVTGPLAPELQAPVGLLAVALILYFALAGSSDSVYAHVFLLPLVVSFLLQPLGRQAWAGRAHAPRAAAADADASGARPGDGRAREASACSRSAPAGPRRARATSPGPTGELPATATPTATTRSSPRNGSRRSAACAPTAP